MRGISFLSSGFLQKFRAEGKVFYLKRANWGLTSSEKVILSPGRGERGAASDFHRFQSLRVFLCIYNSTGLWVSCVLCMSVCLCGCVFSLCQWCLYCLGCCLCTCLFVCLRQAGDTPNCPNHTTSHTHTHTHPHPQTYKDRQAPTHTYSHTHKNTRSRRGVR